MWEGLLSQWPRWESLFQYLYHRKTSDNFCLRWQKKADTCDKRPGHLQLCFWCSKKVFSHDDVIFSEPWSSCWGASLTLNVTDPSFGLLTALQFYFAHLLTSSYLSPLHTTSAPTLHYHISGLFSPHPLSYVLTRGFFLCILPHTAFTLPKLLWLYFFSPSSSLILLLSSLSPAAVSTTEGCGALRDFVFFFLFTSPCRLTVISGWHFWGFK